MIDRARREEYQELGRLTSGRHRIVLGVTVEIGESSEASLYRSTGNPLLKPVDPSPPQGILWSGKVEFDVEIVPSIDDLIPPRRDAALDESLRRSLCLLDSTLRLEADSVAFPELLDTVFSLEIELWEDGKLLQRGSRLVEPLLGLRLACPEKEKTRFSMSFLLEEISHRGGATPSMLHAFELRIRGTERDTSKSWDAASRWDGSLSLVLADLPVCPEEKQ